MQRQTAVGRGHAVLDQPHRVDAISQTPDSPGAAMEHQMAQQMDEQLGGQAALIRAVPKPALGVHARDGANRLTLTRTFRWPVHLLDDYIAELPASKIWKVKLSSSGDGTTKPLHARKLFQLWRQKMGVDLTVLDFLTKFRGKIQGTTLQLGRQGLHIPVQEECQAETILRRYDPHAGFEDIASATGFAERLFQYLGSRSLIAMDNSPYEGAEIIHDLNVPVPIDLHERFDTIFDGGTIEHVYSPPVAFENVKQMLKIGGLFLSVNGANDQLGHGFYQFSPELMWRVFSKEAGFTVELMQIAGVYGTPAPFDTPDPAATGRRMEIGATAGPTYILVAARKIGVQTAERIPAQSDYASIWKSCAGQTHIAKAHTTPSITDELKI